MKKIAISLLILLLGLLLVESGEFTQGTPLRSPQALANEEKKRNSGEIEIIKYTSPEKTNKAAATTELSGITVRRCKNIPKTIHELDEFMIQATDNQEPYAFIQDVLARFEVCSQFKAADSDYLTLLVNEAENGSVAALKEIWKIPESEYFEVMAIFNPSREEITFHRNEFLKLKYRLAYDLALSGSAEATIKLIKAYQIKDPLTQKPNYIKSLAYAEFGLQTIQDNDLFLKIHWLREKILQNSNNEQAALAFDITDSMLIEASSGEN